MQEGVGVGKVCWFEVVVVGKRKPFIDTLVTMGGEVPIVLLTIGSEFSSEHYSIRWPESR